MSQAGGPDGADRPIVLAADADQAAARALAAALGAELGRAETRRFPDGEDLVRVDCDVAGRRVLVVCSMHPVDQKALPLYFLAATARDLGAARVVLVAPYLAYMRQDARFRAGEGVTARYFARLLSGVFDGIVAIDPHLHRIGSLGEIYGVPALAVPSAPRIADWVRREVARPAIIGPDAESEQWVRAVAEPLGCPWHVLAKTRRGDRDVSISPLEADLGDRTPVLVDDIVSTGRTMIETVVQLGRAGVPAPICIGVHAVFAPGAYEDLCAAGAARVVTCNTIPHTSNDIDVGDLLADAVRRFST